jgi:hypothetical protein
MKLRLGTPKYAPAWSICFAAGFGLLLLSRHVSEAVARWTLPFGGLFLAVGLAVSLSGSIAERREWEAKHKGENK